MADNHFIEVSHVYAGYPSSSGLRRLIGGDKSTIVLRDVTINLKQGSQVTMFGLPGAGKSTFLRLLVGGLSPVQGKVIINGRKPVDVEKLSAGYVSLEESEPEKDSVRDILNTYVKTHSIAGGIAELSRITEILGLNSFLDRSANRLSTTERLKINIARASLSDSPLILFDDTADELGVVEFKEILNRLFSGRTVIVATRFTDTAEKLDLPILLLHGGTVVHFGSCSDIADELACSRVVNVWLEGLRYDFLRNLRRRKGVIEVTLLPTTNFSGQKLRIKLHSANYLPSFYDVVTQAPLVKIQEVPPSLREIMEKL